MDDDATERSFAKRLFVLERPAPVVGECLAAEELGVVGLRLVGEQDDDLARDIGLLVIVPTKLGGDDAVPDVDRLGVELDERLLAMVDRDEIVQVGECFRAAVPSPRQLGFRQRLNPNQRDFLEVCTVIARRLSTRQGELRGDVFGRQNLRSPGDSPALQGVAREPFRVRSNAVSTDQRGRVSSRWTTRTGCEHKDE